MTFGSDAVDSATSHISQASPCARSHRGSCRPQSPSRRPLTDLRRTSRFGLPTERRSKDCSLANQREFVAVAASPAATLRTALPPDRVHAFLSDDRNHHQTRHMISPPPAKYRVQKQPTQENR